MTGGISLMGLWSVARGVPKVHFARFRDLKGEVAFDVVCSESNVSEFGSFISELAERIRVVRL